MLDAYQMSMTFSIFHLLLVFSLLVYTKFVYLGKFLINLVISKTVFGEAM